jgi:hypothetical protein
MAVQEYPCPLRCIVVAVVVVVVVVISIIIKLPFLYFVLACFVF